MPSRFWTLIGPTQVTRLKRCAPVNCAIFLRNSGNGATSRCGFSGPGVALFREAGEPVVHIGRIADLAGLAIADDVDANLGLPLDDIEHRLPDCPVEFRGVVGGPAFARIEQPHHRLGARQAADMGGENPLIAGFHVCSLLRLNLMADPPLARMQQRVDRDRKQKQQKRQREDIDDVVAFGRPDQGIADAGR